MVYTTEFTDADIKSLRWFVDRGYFPESTFNALYQETDNGPWFVPEHAAWDLVGDPDLGVCMAPELLEKVLKLTESIV